MFKYNTTGYRDKLGKCCECKGACCERNPGCLLPTDFNEPIKDHIKTLLKENKIAIDCWEGVLDAEITDSPYFLRPATVGITSYLDRGWGGKCVLLSSTGCELPFENRPSGCRLLEPMNTGCFSHGADKAASCRAWWPYQDMIDDILKELSTNTKERDHNETV